MTLTPDQWRRARELFERALDEQPADLDAWLARQVTADEAVRAEVGSLLQHHTDAGAFLSQPVADRLAALLEDRPPLAAGQVIGSYTIVREIGRGGMGRVYLATDARLGRTLALKALAPELARSDRQRERLRREARAAAGLTHPGICTIYALEELDGELYIAAQFVDGRTLREEIAGGRRPTAGELMKAAHQLASALASAHAKGITHRDLKPENVMRAPDGRLMILDFGLALIDPAFGGAAAHVTEPGALIGTPAYMAPEQLNGGPVDARTDIFALGVLLYEYATGVHPFDAATPLARAARVLEMDPNPITAMRDDLPAQLVFVIDRCLRKSAVDRFASAADIIGALARGDAAVPRSRVSRWWRTHQIIAIGLYLLASSVAWQAKEWGRGITVPLFLVVGICATVASVFRGHLLFTERFNRPWFAAERRRAEPITLVVDLAIAVALAIDGALLAGDRQVASVLTMALAVGIALARLVVERSTTSAAFGEFS